MSLFALLFATALAGPDQPVEVLRNVDDAVEPEPPDPKSGFSFLGLVQARTVMFNVATTNPLLDGQIIGVLAGLNGTTTADDKRSWVTEMRASTFFTYRPPILDDRVAITGGFEIDFGFGDSAYGTTGNRGGGLGADQVNIQTRRVHVDVLAVKKRRHTLNLRLGIQFLADTARDPVVSRPDDLFRTGGGLRFFGSDAAGLQAFGTVRDTSGVRLRYRLGAFSLWEQGSAEFDDTSLFLADAEYLPTASTRVGVHVWYLNDDSTGTGGFFGVGPTSQLAEMQGAARVDLRTDEDDTPAVNADAIWLGADGGYNHDLRHGPFGLNAGAFLNLGRLTVQDVGWAPILGWHANAEARMRYASGKGSIIRLGFDVTSADNPDTSDFGTVLTGNSYGIVGAVHGSHGAILLHPDITSINRMSSVVFDISAQGRGLLAGQLGVAYDLIPNRLNLGATVAHASSIGNGTFGTEINGRLTWEPFTFFTVGLTGGAVLGTQLPVDPWTTYAHMQWVVF
jgi:hypothetical protein